MAGCEKQAFPGIDIQHFTELMAKGEELGLPIDGPSGQAKHSGVTIAWVYDSHASTLHIQCIEAPAFLPCGMIEHEIKKLVHRVMEELGIPVPDEA